MSSSILFPTNEFSSTSKSSEEIQKLMTPQFLTHQDMICYLINKNLALQMPYVYKNFHQCYKMALVFVCQKAPTEEPENRILICESLKIVLQNQDHNKLTNQELEIIFEAIIECLNNLHCSANQDLRQIIEMVIENHTENKKLIKRLEEVILDLGKPSQPIISKVTSGRLISILAKYIGRMIKGQMIDILKRILADTEVEAKKIWVIEIFPKLLQNLELQFIQLHLQEKIYQSVYDQNEEIGILALEIILKNATKFSIEEQSSRIVKLFIDSLTAKNEKICLMASEIMGKTYQKLQNIILKNESNCIKFWRAVIEISQSKNEKILNNVVFNLPGILMISNAIYKVEPMCELSSNKILLASYFHQMVRLFPAKYVELKDIVFWMFNELFQDEDPVDQAIKVMSKIIATLHKSKNVFIGQLNSLDTIKQINSDLTNEKEKDKEVFSQQEDKYFCLTFCEYLGKFLNLLLIKKNGPLLFSCYTSLKNCFEYFPLEFIEMTLLPKLYSALRMKTPYVDLVIEIMVCLLTRDCSYTTSGGNNLINIYASKINIELSKSNKSYEREAALQFFYHASFYFSIDLFQEYKFGEKFLYFNNDKCFKNKVFFIKYLPRINYFFNRQEKIQNAIILSRLTKDSDQEIIRILQNINFTENQETRNKILEQSKKLKEKEKEKATLSNNKKAASNIRRSSKQIKKEDILKKRIETTKSKTKMVIKEVSKKKTMPALAKTNSNLNFRKNS